VSPRRPRRRSGPGPAQNASATACCTPPAPSPAAVDEPDSASPPAGRGRTSWSSRSTESTTSACGPDAALRGTPAPHTITPAGHTPDLSRKADPARPDRHPPRPQQPNTATSSTSPNRADY
jgi:hypothetical protein